MDVMLKFFLMFFRLCILVPFFLMWYFYAFWSEDCSLMGQCMEFVTCSHLRYGLNLYIYGVLKFQWQFDHLGMLLFKLIVFTEHLAVFLFA